MNTTGRLVEVKRHGISFLTDPRAAASGLLLAFTNREGGVSPPPYKSLNLSFSVGDDEERVTANRRGVARAVGFDIYLLTQARQVHGAGVLEVGPGSSGVAGDADALILKSRGCVAAVLTADCVPVVLAAEGSVAVVHAGWRGLIAGVIQNAAKKLPAPNRAWIGPCIHECCFEVGPEVVTAFQHAGLAPSRPDRINLPLSAAAVLRSLGVEDVAISDACTSCDNRYFSHRRDAMTGRQGTFASLIKPGPL